MTSDSVGSLSGSLRVGHRKHDRHILRLDALLRVTVIGDRNQLADEASARVIAFSKLLQNVSGVPLSAPACTPLSAAERGA